LVTNTLPRFEVHAVKGKTVVSNIPSLAQEHAKQCLLTWCITHNVFPYNCFITVDSELDFGKEELPKK
jgi:hypothetical protein